MPQGISGIRYGRGLHFLLIQTIVYQHNNKSRNIIQLLIILGFSLTLFQDFGLYCKSVNFHATHGWLRIVIFKRWAWDFFRSYLNTRGRISCLRCQPNQWPLQWAFFYLTIFPSFIVLIYGCISHQGQRLGVKPR